MIHALFRGICFATVRLFYRQIRVRGAERIPAQGPVMVVSNHPNGLMDPMLIRLALDRPIGFLAKSTLFGNAAARLAMEAFSVVPVYRRVDGADISRNERTFELCRERFAAGRWLVMFPEGVSHSEPRLLPLKTGAARIALGAEAERGFELGLQIVAVGLVYEAKETFRSRVAVTVGEPFSLEPWSTQYVEEPREAVSQLTARIADAMSDVVLEADSQALWRGFLAVARWTDPQAAVDMAACEERARRMAGAYRRMMADDPVGAEAILERTQAFVRAMKAVGVEDPLEVERAKQPARPAGFAAALMRLVLLAPFALAGVVVFGASYQLVDALARRMAGEEGDILSTLKALLALVIFALTLVLAGAFAWWAWGPLVAAIVVLSSPICGLAALRFLERLAMRRRALRAFWMRLTRARVVDELDARRSELSSDIDAALARYG